MQNIPGLLQKLTELIQKKEKVTTIEVDLMLDHTRKIYDELLAWRNKIRNNPEINVAQGSSVRPESHSPKEVKQSVPERKMFTPPKLHRYINTEPAKEYHSIKPDPTISRQQQPSLKSIIGVNDRYLFISELFGNSNDAYNEVINELERFDTYDQATNWLNTKVYNQYGWDEQNDTVQSFYYVLSQYFASM
jgi:hypothetical protein